jgi:23S rRNA-/tRNA-specific pseudouridylate synthase
MTVHVPESQEVQQYRRALHREKQLRLLESRLRSRLRKMWLTLHKTRGKKGSAILGRYHVRHRWNVMPILHHVDLPTLARQVGVYFEDLDIQ